MEHVPTPPSGRTAVVTYHVNVKVPGAKSPSYPSEHEIQAFIRSNGVINYTPTGVSSTVRIRDNTTSMSIRPVNSFAERYILSVKERICYYNFEGHMIAVSHIANVVLSDSISREAPAGWS